MLLLLLLCTGVMVAALGVCTSTQHTCDDPMSLQLSACKLTDWEFGDTVGTSSSLDPGEKENHRVFVMYGPGEKENQRDLSSMALVRKKTRELLSCMALVKEKNSICHLWPW